MSVFISILTKSDEIIKGIDQFLGCDFFYLWTDPGEISTEYVKLKKKIHFVREHFLIFGIVFEKIRIFVFFWLFIFEISKE